MLTRQQALWWNAPTLRYWRDCLLKGTGALGSNLPVLKFAHNLGWYVRGAADLTPLYKRATWQELGNTFSITGSAAWEEVEGVLAGCHTELGGTESTDPNVTRLCRFLATAYARFTGPDAEVPSLWSEDGNLLCGWDPLPPEDGRLPSRKQPEQLPLWWFDWVEQVDTKEWLWRVEAEDCRYEEVYADHCWEVESDDGTEGVQKEARKAQNRGAERVKRTGEVFTPMPLVKQMVEEIPGESLQEGRKALDPSCGDGNFLVGLRKRLGSINGDPHAVNKQIYGSELMPDNVAIARRRLGLVQTDSGWGHVICTDFLEEVTPERQPWYN